MPDREPSELKQRAAKARDEQHGLGVRSPVSHKLHPTAQKILAAARTVLTERGYHGMTLQAIAAEANVNKAGIWYYFGGKQQLVLALLEDITVGESLHFGAVPPADATLAERVDLIVGRARELQERVRRFAVFYELVPEASRDEELQRHLQTYYQAWYEWAAEVLAPAIADSEAGVGEAGAGETGEAEALGQFASILLDGVIMQMMIAAPGFHLDAALENARRSLTALADGTARGQTASS